MCKPIANVIVSTYPGWMYVEIAVYLYLYPSGSGDMILRLTVYYKYARYLSPLPPKKHRNGTQNTLRLPISLAPKHYVQMKAIAYGASIFL